MACVLIVDDNASVREALGIALTVEGFETKEAADPARALEIVASDLPDAVIQDMNFSADTTSGEEGVALFHALRDQAPKLPIVLLTAWTQLQTAVALVREGALDYLAKPWDDEQLIDTIRVACGSPDKSLPSSVVDYDTRGMVYESRAMQDVVRMACRVAPSDVPVLITGPSGVGKERLAEIVHFNSPVADGPLVRVNVGALPSELVAAELFGAEAGAFTGAGKARAGRFEAADGGSLFLDEIGTMAADDQVKLLRVLQSGEFQRLGSTRSQHVNVRIISATNACLEDAVSKGHFREDLLYRLNVVELRVPALADRKEDILPIAEHFLPAGNRLTPAARTRLTAHDWPGNVRELENCLRRASLMADEGQIDVASLQLTSRRTTNADLDRESLERVLAENDGVVAASARALGLSRQALYRLMERLGVARR